MIIGLIILIVVLANSCETTPTPTPVPPPPPPCTWVMCAASCEGPLEYSGCGTCPSGTTDVTWCWEGPDAGPIWSDGGRECDTAPCFRPAECTSTCDADEEPVYYGCCECPEGTFDRVTSCGADAGVDGGPPIDAGDGGGGLLGAGAECFDDRQCESGFCYGTVASDGSFETPTCQVSCLPADDRAHYCTSDRHCCGLVCCVGCGEREGLCVREGTGPPGP